MGAAFHCEFRERYEHLALAVIDWRNSA